MNAGKALDDLVSEKVMGWGKCLGCCDGRCIGWKGTNWTLDEEGYFKPSTDIKAAMAVVDHMATKNWSWMLKPGYATFQMTRNTGVDAFGASVQHAICLAALKATGVKL